MNVIHAKSGVDHLFHLWFAVVNQLWHWWWWRIHIHAMNFTYDRRNFWRLGFFNLYEEMTTEDTWKKYGVRNGVNSIEELISLTINMLKDTQLLIIMAKLAVSRSGLRYSWIIKIL